MIEYDKDGLCKKCRLPGSGFVADGVCACGDVYYQIGTSEPRGVVGSRAAQSTDLAEAIEECRERSLSRSIKEAWVRPIENGKMGDVIVSFVNGVRQ